jgi:hypothetical protein
MWPIVVPNTLPGYSLEPHREHRKSSWSRIIKTYVPYVSMWPIVVQITMAGYSLEPHREHRYIGNIENQLAS